ncbi:hypothetical protein GGR52DRAFT_297475 [Hypoxylon sp. FL1284]|nr:hypothetical protein GGR52DRAFT_297475 [Hypoxylon sp. FL1284]
MILPLHMLWALITIGVQRVSRYVNALTGLLCESSHMRMLSQDFIVPPVRHANAHTQRTYINRDLRTHMYLPEMSETCKEKKHARLELLYVNSLPDRIRS